MDRREMGGSWSMISATWRRVKSAQFEVWSLRRVHADAGLRVSGEHWWHAMGEG